MREKQTLIGDEVTVTSSLNGLSLTWKVIPDIKEADVARDDEFQDVGIAGFDFNNTIVKGGPRNSLQRINLLALMIHLWPGDWKEQLKVLNIRIQVDNEVLRRHCSHHHGRPKLTAEITENEFWVWWGLMLTARIMGRKGSLWDRLDSEGLRPRVDFSRHMSENRFEHIRKKMPFLWASNNKKAQGDPWWQFLDAIDEFNKNRKRTVLSSFLKVLDESMSAWRPQTTALGNLQHLSCIQRKPEPLGTELKVVVDSVLQMMLYLEIQKGKIVMRSAEFCDVMKSTVACTTRLAKYTTRNGGSGATENVASTNVKEIWLGDAWFASVTTAKSVEQYGRFIGPVKTSHALFCKKYLETKMASWPAGSHLVLETKFQDLPLLAIGYKYNKRKVLSFVATKGAGHTETTTGHEYHARWIDDNGMTAMKDIPRPEIIAKYFQNSNVVDVHNQCRQFELALEKHWITKDCWFRLITTLFGICVVDCWQGYRHHLARGHHRHREISLEDFIDMMANDMLNNDHSKAVSQKQALVINLPEETNETSSVSQSSAVMQTSTLDDATVFSALTDFTSGMRERQPALEEIHTEEVETEMEAHEVIDVAGRKRRGERLRRGKCIDCHRKTSSFCKGCPVPKKKCLKPWFCGRRTKRPCFQNHLDKLPEEADFENPR